MYVYILASDRNGTLYIGVTNNLVKRVLEHRAGTGSKFTSQYSVLKLVYYEKHEWITGAIRRETQMKKWNRDWKLKLIENMNPQWKDLLESLV